MTNSRAKEFRARQMEQGRKRSEIWWNDDEEFILRSLLKELRHTQMKYNPDEMMSLIFTAIKTGGRTNDRFGEILPTAPYDPSVDASFSIASHPGGNDLRASVSNAILSLGNEGGNGEDDEIVRYLAIEGAGSVPVLFGLLRAYVQWIATTMLVLHPKRKTFVFRMAEWDVVKDLSSIVNAVRATRSITKAALNEADLAILGDVFWFFASRGRCVVGTSRRADLETLAADSLWAEITPRFELRFMTDLDSAWQQDEWEGSVHLKPRGIPKLGSIWTRIFASAILGSGMRLASALPDLERAHHDYNDSVKLLHRFTVDDFRLFTESLQEIENRRPKYTSKRALF